MNRTRHFLFLSICFVILFILTGTLQSEDDTTLLSKIITDRILTRVARAPGEDVAYGITGHTKDVYLLDLTTYQVKNKITLANAPRAIAVDPTTKHAYIVSQSQSLFNPVSSLSVMDTNGAILQSVTLPRFAGDIAIDSQTGTAAIAFRQDKKIRIYSADTLSLLREISLSYIPGLIALNQGSTRALVSGKDSVLSLTHRRLLIFDLATGSTLHQIIINEGITGIGIDSAEEIAVVTSLVNVYLIDINTGTILHTIPSSLTANNENFKTKLFLLTGLTDFFVGVDLNESTHQAVVAGNGGFLLINLLDGTSATYQVPGIDNYLSPVVDPYYNTLLASYLNIANPHSEMGVAEIQLPNPVPELTALNPAEVTKGHDDQRVAVTGNRFVIGSGIAFADQALPTTFIDNQQLTAVIPKDLLLSAGTISVTVTNPAPQGGVSNALPFSVVNTAPTLTLLDPASAFAGSSNITLTLGGTGFRNETAALVNGQNRSAVFVSPTQMQLLLTQADLAAAGTCEIALVNPEPGGGTSNAMTFSVVNPEPVIVSISPNSVRAGSGETTLTLTGGNFTLQSTVSFNNTNVPADFVSATQLQASVPAGLLATQGTYQVQVVSPPPGGGSAAASFTVSPASNVTPLPEGSFGKQYEALVPPDATIQSYDPKRISIITGLVKTMSGSPLSGVTVSILNNRPYGSAQTDASGRFSLPLDGGATYTMVYMKQGYLTSHRQVYIPWNDIAVTETLSLITEDSTATAVTFDGNPGTVLSHRSTPYTDERGLRSATMVFTGDNTAYIKNPDGTETPASNITVRATEFTTPESMPAILPPNSAYTYCTELAVDGATNVRFEKPVTMYVENFLGFDVGMIVPVGYYDRDRGVWAPSDNGKVVRLLDTNGDGMADAYDDVGDGQAHGTLTGLNDPMAYAPGKTFWRVAVSHFTPWDCNWPYGPPLDATGPDSGSSPSGDQQKDDNNADRSDADCTGSYTECRSRIIHEDIPITGADITLHYASSRVPGHKAAISVPASGSTVPASLKSITVSVQVAGRILETILPPQPNQKAEIGWDGLDYLGRHAGSSATAHVKTGFTYQAVYYSAGSLVAQSFAQAGTNVTGIRARQEVTLWKEYDARIDAAGPRQLGQGWTLSLHHYMNPTDPTTLFMGNGKISKNFNNMISTVAGNGQLVYSGDGGPAVSAGMYPSGITVDPVGNLYIVESYNNRIRKVDKNGIISTVAGNGSGGYSGDGGPAVSASLYDPRGITVDPAGNLYIADTSNHRLRKVDTNGIISTVAGNGSYGCSGDGGPAVSAGLNSPYGITIDPAGSLYIADTLNSRIRKVDTNGIISTVAGNGAYGYSGDGGPAVSAMIGYASGIAVDPVGNLYIAAFNHIRKVDASGIITRVAGGNGGYSGDGQPAASIWVNLNSPHGIALDSAGNLYIADTYNNRIRKIDTTGIITTVAGNGTGPWTGGYSGDGGPAFSASLYWPQDVTVDPAGNLYIADVLNYRIRRISAPVYSGGGDVVFSDDSGLGYVMESAGIHKSTIDLHTGIALKTFGYDGSNRLISIADPSGNTTTIQRNGSGNPFSITSPDGLVTSLVVDGSGNLTKITAPDGGAFNFEYGDGGLLTAKVDPKGKRFSHTFDANGRVSAVTDPEGGQWNYSRTLGLDGTATVISATAEGNATSYQTKTDSTGAYTSITTTPSNNVTTFTTTADGLTDDKNNSCGAEEIFRYDLDPVFKYRYMKELDEIMPSGLARITLTGKTYQDTNSDNIPDLITASWTFNGKAVKVQTDTLASTMIRTSPSGRTMTSTYSPTTLLSLSTSVPGLFDTSFGYDARGRLMSAATGDRTTGITYNAKGFIDTVTLPDAKSLHYTYDDAGRIKTKLLPGNITVGFDYDPNGNLINLTNPRSVSTGFDYTGVNLRKTMTIPLSGAYTYSYDKERNLKSVLFPSGKRIDLTYTSGLLSSTLSPEGTTGYSYACGRDVSGITRGSETLSYTYDGALLTQDARSGLLNQTIGYGYNSDFNMTSLTYAGSPQTYGYDNDGLLTTASPFTITRNALNGLPESVSGGAVTAARSFSGYGELDSVSYVVGSSTPYHYALTRDGAGRITRKQETVSGGMDTYDYAYDDAGRLTGVTKNNGLVESYSYDANGNRQTEINALRSVNRSYSVSLEDHVITAGSASYQFDVDGFLTQKTIGASTTAYHYSSRGELLSALLPNGTAITYDHDPLGRRIAKRVNGSITEKYLWQGSTRLLAVYDGSNNLILRFTYADERMPLSMTYSGATYYLFYDQIGSLRAVSDTSGSIVKRVDYDAYGSIITDTHPALSLPLGFAGGLFDKDTGLVRFGARDYDPALGRWTAKDPIDFAGGDTNLYGYVQNDPVSFADPLGLWRSHPRYGNWGGADWSGGPTGNENPVDSMDECFRGHDSCYENSNSANNCKDTDRKKCDQELVCCLYKLPKSPLNWTRRPKDPIYADFYRSWAIGYFQ